MHPTNSHRNSISQPNHRAVIQGRSLRHRIRVALENWKRQRMIAALKRVNRHWLVDAGIDRNTIERLVDDVLQRDIPQPRAARSVLRDESRWKNAA